MSWIWLVLIACIVGVWVWRSLPSKGVRSISPDELKQLLKDKKSGAQLVDVREPSEFRSGHIQGFQNIPLGELAHRSDALDKERPVVVMCRSGARSARAAKWLARHGFRDVRNLSGGIMAWNASKRRTS
ncbi:rhodanese-like domain-containing protein [Alicyclobacillus vulcanalis]|uniref:Rhodanese-related sulfurtransferase n=1 Tax=Alicyclobacillus vulcanalis TaxID=252246 RepID=A0A1N7NND0_9BACL|nr:rhodanese-like domain-containing protein [Alicyclobacillus vulcanalis]SIS99791.1 Rhodanese-related sulfurtransferase [Alicyclobacillus vulcanalis]